MKGFQLCKVPCFHINQSYISSACKWNGMSSAHKSVWAVLLSVITVEDTTHYWKLSTSSLSLASSIKVKQQLHPPTSLQACMPFKYNVRSNALPLYGVDWCCNSVTVNVNGGYRSRRSWCGRESSFAQPNACELKHESVCFSLLCLSFNITLDSVSIQWMFNVNHTLVFLRVCEVHWCSPLFNDFGFAFFKYIYSMYAWFENDLKCIFNGGKNV